jgi:hypothetical protein
MENEEFELTVVFVCMVMIPLLLIIAKLIAL